MAGKRQTKPKAAEPTPQPDPAQDPTPDPVPEVESPEVAAPRTAKQKAMGR